METVTAVETVTAAEMIAAMAADAATVDEAERLSLGGLTWPPWVNRSTEW